MLLAIDVGNTNMVFGLYDGDKLRGSFRISTNSERTSDELGMLIAQYYHFHDIACAELRLGDHYSFEVNPFEHWDTDYIFVTGKDAVKCRQIPELAQDPRIWAVDLEMHLDPYLIELVLGRLKELTQTAPKNH